jgi:hypothetical protein
LNPAFSNAAIIPSQYSAKAIQLGGNMAYYGVHADQIK